MGVPIPPELAGLPPELVDEIMRMVGGPEGMMPPPPMDPAMMGAPMPIPGDAPIPPDMMAMMQQMAAQPPEPPPHEDEEEQPNGIFAPPNIPTPRTEELKTRIKDYKLKKANGGKKPKAPEMSHILDQKNRREKYWQTRNNRMMMDEELYLLAHMVERPVKGEERFTKLTPRTTVDKLSYMIGRQKDKISVTARAPGPEYETPAQNIEDFLYHFREVANDKHQAKLNQGLGRDEAWYAACRGWLVSRVYFDVEAAKDGEELPLCIDLMDPKFCYPQMGRSGAGMCMNMIYAEKTDVSNFIASNPWAVENDYIRNLDSDDEIEVVWYEDEWYSITIVDEEVVKEVEHNYGFCPWVVSLAGGAPLRHDQARGQLGCGVLTPMRGTILMMDRMLSALATNIQRSGNPARIRKHNSTTGGINPPEPMDVTPGADNVIDEGKGEGYDTVPINAPPLETQMLFDAMMDDVRKQGILGQLYGDAEGAMSGFHQAVIQNAAEDALYPVVDCIIQHRKWQCKLALNIVLAASESKLLPRDVERDEKTGVPNEGVYYNKKNRAPGSKSKLSKRGPKFELGVLKPEDITKHGVDGITISMHRMTPQDLMQMTQAAAMAVSAKLLSIEYIRSEWLDIDDPVEMNLQVMYELIYQDEELMKEVFLPLALKSDPTIYEMYMKKHQERKELEAAEREAAMMGAPAAGPPGVPNQMLPSQMQPDQTVPADMMAMEALMPEMMNQAPV